MTPTPEQVAQWAREAGDHAADVCDDNRFADYETVRDNYLVTRAMAAQAEDDAKLCDRFAQRDMHPAECAAAIRRHAPKVTT